MDTQIIETSLDLNDWLSTPAGVYLRAWETAQFDRVIADIFGYHALQLGTSVIQRFKAVAYAIAGLAKTSSPVVLCLPC
jgi:hypothetical protein